MHLRGGLLPLARAALEQMAGAGTLDRDAMADLAEVRWRSGDLEGAADAARAHASSGGAEPFAVLIIAEDLARVGRQAEAHDFANAVLERVGGVVDPLFASEPRSPVWPAADDGWMPQDGSAPGRWGLLAGGSEVAAPTPQTWQLEPVDTAAAAVVTEAPATTTHQAPLGRGGLSQPSGQASTSAVLMSGRLAGEELESVDRSIASGDTNAAAHRLAVLLRLDPALAPVILSAADKAAATTPQGGSRAALHLVRGDAYRILGRDNEAAAAYQQAHQALTTGPSPKEPT